MEIKTTYQIYLVMDSYIKDKVTEDRLNKIDYPMPTQKESN